MTENDEFAWIEPLRKKTREIQEETKRIREERVEKVKFTQITRTICPRTGTHYLDAISDEGELWFAEIRTDQERWPVFVSTWKKSGQMPYTK